MAHARGLKTEKIKGGLTQQDMVSLEAVKNKYFFDYKKVALYLE